MLCEALSLYVRLSFVHTPLGGKPEIYGHSFWGPRLQIQRVQSRITGSEGHLVASGRIAKGRTGLDMRCKRWPTHLRSSSSARRSPATWLQEHACDFHETWTAGYTYIVIIVIMINDDLAMLPTVRATCLHDEAKSCGCLRRCSQSRTLTDLVRQGAKGKQRFHRPCRSCHGPAAGRRR